MTHYLFMDNWPTHILCYAPDAEQRRSAQQVLPSDRGFSIEIAPTDRFFGRLMNCYRFDVLVTMEPQTMEEVALIWRYRRHSRCNSQIPMLIVGTSQTQTMASLLSRKPGIEHILLPAGDGMIRKRMMSIAHATDHIPVRPARTGTPSRPGGWQMTMPTALASLLPVPVVRMADQPA